MEFNLSRKREKVLTWGNDTKYSYEEKNVKEFIRLRDVIDREYMLGQITRQEHADKCDKLAGDDLI